jgi:predicted amidohydrolase
MQKTALGWRCIALAVSIFLGEGAMANFADCARGLQTHLKVAAVQFPLAERASADEFLAQVEGYLNEAAANGARLIVFPELIATALVDWEQPVPEQMRRIAAEFTPRYFVWIANQAKRLGVSILGGTAPRQVLDGIVNTAILAFPDGRAVLQDKLHLTPGEKDWGWRPGERLNGIEAPWGATVILTCFDCEFPSVSQQLADFRPEVILVPSWTSSLSGLNRVDWTAKARAVEHYAYVIKTGTVPASDTDEDHFGRAAIVSPQDEGFPVQATEGVLNVPGIVYSDLELARLRKGREESGYYPVKEEQSAGPLAPLDGP